MKYYNNCLFHSVVSNFIVQTGDPTGTGKGGSSVYGCVAMICVAGCSAELFDPSPFERVLVALVCEENASASP